MRTRSKSDPGCDTQMKTNAAQDSPMHGKKMIGSSVLKLAKARRVPITRRMTSFPLKSMRPDCVPLTLRQADNPVHASQLTAWQMLAAESKSARHPDEF